MKFSCCNSASHGLLRVFFAAAALVFDESAGGQHEWILFVYLVGDCLVLHGLVHRLQAPERSALVGMRGVLLASSALVP